MRGTLREQLTRDGAFSVVEAGSIEEAETCLGANVIPFAGLIVERFLPDGDGEHFCARMRNRGLFTPVVLMDGRFALALARNTLTIAKPFRLSELIAFLRMTVLNAAPAKHIATRPSVGTYALHITGRALIEKATGARVRLTEKEGAILALLLSKSGQVVSRQELLTSVWGYRSNVSTHTLETHIYRIRRKIEPNPSHASVIVTGVGGYRIASAA